MASFTYRVLSLESSWNIPGRIAEIWLNLKSLEGEKTVKQANVLMVSKVLI